MSTQLDAPRRVRHLNVSEHFGPTIQGEGRNAGQLSSFFRLAGCNLSCSWCDSAYTWDWTRFNHAEESHSLAVDELVPIIAKLPGRIIVTGGEPLLQHVGLADLMGRPELAGRLWDLETNGTRPLGLTAPYWANITCSPKIIPSADQGPVAHKLDHDLIADPRTDLKFVIDNEADLWAVDLLILGRADVGSAARHGRVWLMPRGTTPDALSALTPLVIQAAADRGLHFTSRLHVYGWHDVRGH
jgi:7-carboxy-7-deazaguanine synthase